MWKVKLSAATRHANLPSSCHQLCVALSASIVVLKSYSPFSFWWQTSNCGGGCSCNKSVMHVAQGTKTVGVGIQLDRAHPQYIQ
jgi:hypothetical protein